MTRVAILISGTGTNMATILNKVNKGDLPCDVAFVASDNPNAGGLHYAESIGVKTVVLPYKAQSREDAEEFLHELCISEHIEWIVLAGFMKILSSKFVRRWENKIVNIHPALLPSFPGTNGIKDAWDYGVKITGVTIHLVDHGVDSGIILAQKAVPIENQDTLESLTVKIHETEHLLYWKTLKKLFEGSYSFCERRSIDGCN